MVTILGSFRVASVSQLPEPIEPVAEVVVAEGVADTEFLLCCYPNLELVLCPGVCYDFPVVLPVHERSVRYHGSEQVICLHKKSVPVIRRKIDFFRRVVRIPAKLVDIWTEIQQLQILPCVCPHQLRLHACWLLAHF